MAQPGVRLRISALSGGCGLMRKIAEMGLNTGAEIEIRQNENGAIVVCRGQSRYAIGRGMAHKILVETIEQSPNGIAQK